MKTIFGDLDNFIEYQNCYIDEKGYLIQKIYTNELIITKKYGPFKEVI